MLIPPPLSLYIHIPWCVRKCPYCDFNSHQQKGDLPIAEYVAALTADLEQDLPLAWGRSVHSVFFGGGTPSLFPPAAIGAILDACSARLRFAPGAEITMECNPGTAEHGRFEEYLRAADIILGHDPDRRVERDAARGQLVREHGKRHELGHARRRAGLVRAIFDETIAGGGVHDDRAFVGGCVLRGAGGLFFCRSGKSGWAQAGEEHEQEASGKNHLREEVSFRLRCETN